MPGQVQYERDHWFISFSEPRNEQSEIRIWGANLNMYWTWTVDTGQWTWTLDRLTRVNSLYQHRSINTISTSIAVKSVVLLKAKLLLESNIPSSFADKIWKKKKTRKRHGRSELFFALPSCLRCVVHIVCVRVRTLIKWQNNNSMASGNSDQHTHCAVPKSCLTSHQLFYGVLNITAWA